MNKILSDLAFKDGPIYLRFQMALQNWKNTYKKRDAMGDDSVIKFLEHFGELKNEQ